MHRSFIVKSREQTLCNVRDCSLCISAKRSLVSQCATFVAKIHNVGLNNNRPISFFGHEHNGWCKQDAVTYHDHWKVMHIGSIRTCSILIYQPQLFSIYLI